MDPVNIQEKIARIKMTTLFNALDPFALRELEALFLTKHFESGTKIIEENDIADCFYIVVEGIVRVSKMGEYGQTIKITDLYKDSFFGEMGLILNIKRTASVYSLNDVTLLALKKEDFDQFLLKYSTIKESITETIRLRHFNEVSHNEINHDELASHFKSIYPLLPEKVLVQLKDHLDWKWYQKGAVIIEKDKDIDYVYYVISGQLEAYDIIDNKECVLGVLDKYSVLGEESAFYNKPTSAHVRSVMDSHLLAIKRFDFEKLVMQFPLFKKQIEGTIRYRYEKRDLVKDGFDSKKENDLSMIEIENTMEMKDVVERNCKITRFYYKSGMMFYNLVNKVSVIWPLVGARASLTAGDMIRKDESVVIGDSFFDKCLMKFSRSLMGSKIDQIFDITALAVANGNIKIFYDMAPNFDAFIRSFYKDTIFDQEKIDAFLFPFNPKSVQYGGQKELSLALKSWYYAIFETDIHLKKERVLLGNCYMAIHEQTRIQMEIKEATESAFRYIVGDELGNLIKHNTLLQKINFEAPLIKLLNRVQKYTLFLIAGEVRKYITKHMMQLRLCTRTISLGSPLRSVPGRHIKITHSDLQELFTRYKLNSTQPSTYQVSDWLNLDLRIAYILQLLWISLEDTDDFVGPIDRL